MTGAVKEVPKRKAKIDLTNILIYIFLFSIVYQSGSVQAANNPDDLLFRITRILMLFAPLFIIRKLSSRKLPKLLFLVFGFEILAIVNFVMYPASSATLQFKILLFVIFYFVVTSSYNRYDLDDKLYNLLIVLATITLVFYIIVDVIKIPLPYSIYYKTEGSAFTYKNYFNIYYSYSKKVFPRLCGLFWEPGVYQIYLNLALFIYYRKQRRNKYHLIIILINVLFTQSTSGYMVAAMMFAVIITSKKRGSMSRKQSRRILIGILAVTSILVIFIYKRETTNIVGDSYFDRMVQAKTGLSLFFENPIFGRGFYNTQQFLELDRTGSGNSNGLITWLYTTGMIGMLVAVVPFLINIAREEARSSKRERITWFIFIVIENMTEPMYSLSIMVYFLASQYSEMINGHIHRMPFIKTDNKKSIII